MSFSENARSWARQQGAPVTIGLLAALVVAFLASWFTRGEPFFEWFALFPGVFRPWTFLSYPFADRGDGTGLLWFLLFLLWFYWVGTSVERDLGARKYAAGLAVATLVGGLFVGLGREAFKVAQPLYGAGLPIAALTVAWGIRNKTAQIRLWAIIPITGFILALLTIAITLFGYGTGSPIVGVLACVPLALAWLFAENRLPVKYSKPVYQYRPSKAKERMDEAYYEDVRQREREREERERLRRLFGEE